MDPVLLWSLPCAFPNRIWRALHSTLESCSTITVWLPFCSIDKSCWNKRTRTAKHLLLPRKHGLIWPKPKPAGKWRIVLWILSCKRPTTKTTTIVALIPAIKYKSFYCPHSCCTPCRWSIASKRTSHKRTKRKPWDTHSAKTWKTMDTANKCFSSPPPLIQRPRRETI